jgi:photosystem II stability/assembly factor-like uncharacterized protein
VNVLELLKTLFLLGMIAWITGCEETPVDPIEADPEEPAPEWTSVYDGLGSLTVQDITSLPGDPPRIFAATLNGCFRLIEGDSVWQESSNGLTSRYINCIVRDPRDPNTLVLGTESNGIFISRDGGEQWVNRWQHSIRSSVISIEMSNSGTLWAGTMEGLYKSTDEGENWSFTQRRGRIEAIESRLDHPNWVIYNVQYGGYFRTEDNGATWVGSNSGIPLNSWGYDRAKELISVPGESSTFFIATYLGHIYKSTDSGNTWQLFKANLMSHTLESLAINRSNPAEMWTVSRDAGVYTSSNGGESWQKESPGLDIKSVQPKSILVSESGTIWLATEGQGVYYYETQ